MIDPFPSFPLALNNTHGKTGTSETRGLKQAKQRGLRVKFKDKPFFSNQQFVERANLPFIYYRRIRDIRDFKVLGKT